MTAAAAIGAEQLRDVRLYGVLGRRFGRVHRLAVANPREAAQALSAVLPGFAEHLVEHSEPGYHVFVGRPGGEDRGPEQLDAPVGTREAICIVPVVSGRKKGWARVVLGIALVVAAPYAAGAAWGAGASVGVAVGIGTVGAGIGKALILGGVVQLLSPQQRGGGEARPEGLASFQFDGPVNTTQEGLPVPLVYGRMITGGAVVSSGIATDELEPEAAPAPMPPQTLPDDEPDDWVAPAPGSGGYRGHNERPPAYDSTESFG